MPAKSLRIAWFGAGPSPWETGGAPGVATELLHGLAKLGHRIDCFSPSASQKLPARVAEDENLTFIWGTSDWRWGRWYSRTKITAFASGLFARGFASLRLRGDLAHRHRREPYDVIYQFSNIESLAVSSRVARRVPVVVHPTTHIAGELRFVIAERRLILRCQPFYTFAIVATIMSLRTLLQRVGIRRARLLICKSRVFRDHLVRDYGVPIQATVVVPDPVRLERFPELGKEIGTPPTVLILGRIALRKGIEDVIALANALRERDADVRLRIVGGPSLWSDYTKLLEDLPAESAEYVGRIPPAEIPAELARSDVLLAASKYEPFGLTVAEALAAGVPVVASSEVGAIEGVDRSVVAEVQVGDIEGMLTAITAMLDRVRTSPSQMRSMARAEAERLFAPDLVCETISAALERLVDGTRDDVIRPDRASDRPLSGDLLR